MVTVIGEVENKKEYLREIHRILKKGWNTIDIRVSR